MASSLGDMLLTMMGNKDPRQQLIQAALGGGTPGAPQPAPGASAQQGTDPGTAAPPQPQAYTSPPQLFELYSKLMEREQKVEGINRSIGLIASGLAQEENRPRIMAAMMGQGSGGSGDENLLGTLLDMQSKQTAAAQMAARRAALPAIASKYGLDLATAQYLFDTGKLDSVIAEAEKPSNEIVSLEDGTKVIVDKNTGKIGEAFGPPKKREIEIKTDDRGTQFAVYKDTGERVGKENLVEGQGATEIEQLWRADEADRAKNSLPPRPLSEFITEYKKQAVTQSQASNTGPNGVDYGDPPKDMVWDRDETGAIKIDPETKAPTAVPIARGPADERGKQKSAADERKTVSDIVTTDIDRVLKIVNDNKDTWVPVTGVTGAATKWIPGSDAHQAEKLIETVKANVGFDKLQAMRAASPTGAALGPVSDFENKLLQAVIGNLELSQQPEHLKYNLERVKKVYSAIVTTGIKDQAEANKIMFGTTEPSLDDLVKHYGD